MKENVSANHARDGRLFPSEERLCVSWCNTPVRVHGLLQLVIEDKLRVPEGHGTEKRLSGRIAATPHRDSPAVSLGAPLGYLLSALT